MSPARPPRILVAGGCNVDTLAHLDSSAIPATSNPGRIGRSAGGVARNVAANLALLGDEVSLVGAVGADESGDFLLDSITAVDTGRVRRSERTGSYLAVIDDRGDLVIGVADMTATETIEDIGPVQGFDWLVLDGNLLPDPVTRALHDAERAEIPVLLDPVGVAKATRLRAAASLRVHTFTPNHDELLAFTGLDDIDEAISAVHTRGVDWVWLRQGAASSRLHGDDGTDAHIAAIPGPVVNVTGAGDAMLAGYLHALAHGAEPVEAAEYGAATATLTIGSPQTVRPDLDDALVRRTIAAHGGAPGEV